MCSYIRQELPKLAKPLIEEVLETKMQELSENMVAKSVEICQGIGTQLMRIFMYQEDQSRPFGAAADGKPPSSMPGQEEGLSLTEILDLDIIAAPFNFGEDFPFHEFLLDDGGGSKLTQDSAYGTLSERCSERRIEPL